MGTNAMKKNGWLRLTILLSVTWVIGILSLAICETLRWDPGRQFFYNYYISPREVAPPSPAPGSEGDYPNFKKEYTERYGRDFDKDMEAWNQYRRDHPNPNDRMPEDKRFFLISGFFKAILWPPTILWLLYEFLYYGGGWVRAGFENRREGK